LSAKFVRFSFIGAAFLLVFVTAVLGADRLGNNAEEPGRVQIVERETKIIARQQCLACSRIFAPELVGLPGELQGKTRIQAKEILDALHPGSSIIVFSKELVEIMFPPGRCPACQLPQRGHIGLVDGNTIAVFDENGSLVETQGEAPGSWLGDLELGIPFDSPEECQALLINLTS